ncbi:MAG: hypothetical protein LBE12_09740 [Planctomycetaceae bacterium]|nr:hypothetical protein [Planctomycetaceae bacterium]
MSFGTSLLFLFIFWGLLFFFHFLISRVENVTILCADDVIVMSENEINLFKKEHLISSLQRNQLNITYRYYAAGSAIFDMWNLSDPSKKITFTSHLNDFEHLVNSIIPNFWPPEMG